MSDANHTDGWEPADGNQTPGPGQEEQGILLSSALDDMDFLTKVLIGHLTPRSLLAAQAAIFMELLAPELDAFEAQGRKNPVKRYVHGQYYMDNTRVKTPGPIQTGPDQQPEEQAPDNANKTNVAEIPPQPTHSQPQTPPEASPPFTAAQQQQQAATASGAVFYGQADVDALTNSKQPMDPLPLEHGQQPGAIGQHETSPYVQQPPGISMYQGQSKTLPYNPPQTQSPAGGHAIQPTNQNAGGQAASASAGQQKVYGDGLVDQNKDWWDTHPDTAGGSSKQPAQSQAQAPKTAGGALGSQLGTASAQTAASSAGLQIAHGHGISGQDTRREPHSDAAGGFSKRPAQSQAQAPKTAGGAPGSQLGTAAAQQQKTTASTVSAAQTAASLAQPQTSQGKQKIELKKPDIPGHQTAAGAVLPSKQTPPALGKGDSGTAAGAKTDAGALDGSEAPTAVQPPPAPTPLADDTVTAHAAAQWKYKEVPPGTPDTYDQYLTDHKEYPFSTVDGARVRGKKHKHEGTNADDWFEVADVDGITILAVSDGAGSRKLSRIGARTACEASVAFIRKQLQAIKADHAAWETLYAQMTAAEGSPEMQQGIKQMGGIINKAMLQAIAAVHSAHEQRRDKPEFEDLLGRKPEFQDFAATMLLAIIVPLRGREKFIVTCQVGDGMITALDLKDPFNAQTTARLLGRPDSGEYSGQTEFITSSSAADEKQLQGKTMICRRPVDLVLAMTDGVADDYYPNQTQMPRLYYDLLANGILEEQRAPAAKLPEGIKLPEPVSYPWVNNPDVIMTLQYANRLLEESGKTIADVWEDRAAIFGEASKTLSKSIGSDVSEKLCTWLDNYVQRGSFDDRTLVIAQLKEADV